MKTTIKNLILSAVLVVGGASCVDLDTAPYDRETDLTYWEEDPEAAVKALNNCYTYLGNMDEQLYSEAMTDNAYTKQPNDFTQNIGNGSYSTADSYVKQVWDGRYTGIRMCNQLLENIDRVPDLDPELKKRYIGEAKCFVLIIIMNCIRSSEMCLIQRKCFLLRKVCLSHVQIELLSLLICWRIWMK